MRSFTIKIYLWALLLGLVFIFPFYVLLFAEHGLSPSEISFVLASWAATKLILEIPSGTIADKYSRRKLLALSSVIQAIGLGFWLFMPNFAGFLIGAILWGLRDSLTSGTFEALLYDELKSYEQEGEYLRIMGRIRLIFYGSRAGSAFAASYIITWGYDAVLIATIIAMLLGSIVPLTIKRVAKVREVLDEHNPVAIFREGFGYCLRHALLFKLLLFVVLTRGVSGGMEEFYPLFIESIGFTPENVGLFIGIFSLMEGIGGLLAYRFKHVHLNELALAHFIIYIAFVMAFFLQGINVIYLIAAFIFFEKMIIANLQARTQDYIPSTVRATILSIMGMGGQVMVMTVYFSFGYFAESYNYQVGFIFFAIVVMIASLLYTKLFLAKKRNVWVEDA